MIISVSVGHLLSHASDSLGYFARSLDSVPRLLVLHLAYAPRPPSAPHLSAPRQPHCSPCRDHDDNDHFDDVIPT